MSDWILNSELPLSQEALREKVEELRKLAETLPDSSSVLNEATPQLDLAKTLLEEAQKAR